MDGAMLSRTLLIGFALLTATAPLPREAVPEPLQPWVDWVLRGHDEAVCAPRLGDAQQRTCAWPARLELTLDENGGSFTQEWDVQRAQWVSLPGAATPWPVEVLLDGAAAVVIAQGDAPALWLTPGRHAISGRFAWPTLPELLPIPAATGLLTLTLRGQSVPFPDRDAAGRLWLQRRAPVADERERVAAVVHRLVDDDIPLQLETHLQLEVSGVGRELLLGPVLPAGFVPMALTSPLPARLEADGRLRLQARAGRWTLQLLARHEGPAAALAVPAASQGWPASEIWVFRAHPELRLVTIEGAEAIDPQQTDLPEDWRQLPAYLLRQDSELRLVERRRGDVGAAADQLALTRTLWLDFDGGGYTVRDRISGELTRAWRLDMAPPTLLGRVAVNGSDQFITRLAADAPAGVEIRAGAIDLDADSRLDGARRDLPAVGWEHDFQSVAATLQLPPGWRLLHAGGVDQARPTWVGDWTLLDLFIVLITALAAGRLFGWPWGLLTLAAVGLAYTEPAAPRGVWLAVLALEALVRVVPDGTARRALALARVLALAALVVLVVPFLIGQIRQALYPALEHPYQSMDVAAPDADGGADFKAVAAAPPAQDGLRDEAASAPEATMQAAPPRRERSYEYAAVDPGVVVQTGPGLPGWSWNTVALEWSGPVERDQHLHLWLLSPSLNLLLAVLRTLLLALLVARLVGLRRNALRGGVAAASAALLLGGGAGVARAEFPSEALLGELRERLLAPPDCQPSCAALPRLRLDADAQSLRLSLRLDVGAVTAVPLPGHALQWVPRTVLVDGAAAAALMQGADGVLWLRLESGTHDVVLEGPLPARDTVQLPLPLAPSRVEAQVRDWRLDGVHADGRADATLQLSRLAPADGAATAPLPADQLPPFARVERTLRLGLTWQVETRVVRLTPPDAALLLAVPLLGGEAVTTAEVRVADGAVQVNLPPQAVSVAWQSTLSERSPIALRAPTGQPWVETWRLDASPIWHVEASGIAAVLRSDVNAAPLREWRPWPDESVRLDVLRPEGVAGQTLTIDESVLAVSPGLRATDATLTLGLRSSRGAQHTVALPPTAELLSVTIDGTAQPIRADAGTVVLPVNPGPQRVELRWRQADGITARLRSPAVDLGAPSVDAHLRIEVPPNRWVLFAGGPRLGPAVLFWSLLPVMALVAIGLGRVRATPLRTRDWLLLGIGLTQVPIAAAVVVAGWLLALGWRRARGAALTARAFDLVQLLLIGWTATAVVILFVAIQQGLLGQPDMQIAGNGSSAALLRWYQDRSHAALPQAWVLSVPLLVYRLLMLAWALWLAQALLRWLRWGWESFGAGGYWRTLRRGTASGSADGQPAS